MVHTLHAPKRQPIGRMKKGYLKFQIVRIEAGLAAGVTQQIKRNVELHHPSYPPSIAFTSFQVALMPARIQTIENNRERFCSRIAGR